MAIAVCIRCGRMKRSAFRACPECGFSPRGDPQAMAESLMLSDAYYNASKDHRPDKAELEQASRAIRSGEAIKWDETVLAEMIREQEVLSQGGDPSWLKVFLLALAFLLLPLLALLVFLLSRK
jgi:hypothetical protein